jgi:hypothetical protein
VRGKTKLTPRGAVWAGLLATPVLVVAAMVAIGVAVAPAGSETANAPAAQAQSADTTPVTSRSRETLAQAQAYWTAERMATADAYPMPTRSGSPSLPVGTLRPVAQPTGPPGAVGGALPGGVPLPAPASQDLGSASQAPAHHPYLTQIPYTRWSLIGRYDKYPNYTILKMFFSQDHDANGTANDFVCSASTFGPDEAWTAGHCVTNNVSGADGVQGVNDGWSFNVLVCPVYDNGFVHGHGCWGADFVVSLLAYRNGGNGNVDFGAIDTTDNGTVFAGTLGNHTGWLGFAWNQPRDQHWVAMGYPAGAPFAGGKIIMAAGGYGYDDDWAPDGVLGVAMGSNLTGGSSGGPWIVNYGLPGQVAGPPAGLQNLINGHNDWKWTGGGVPDQMVSPYYDCRPVAIYNLLIGTSFCP